MPLQTKVDLHKTCSNNHRNNNNYGSVLNRVLQQILKFDLPNTKYFQPQ